MKTPIYRLTAIWLMLGTCVLNAQVDPDLGKLSDYPVQSEVWLGSIVGEVAVDPEIPIEIGQIGDLQWKVEDGATVAVDQVIAVTDAKKIELSKKELELKRSRRQNGLLDIEIASSDKRRSLESNIVDLEGKLAEMEMTTTESSLLGPNFAKRLAAERKKLTAEIKRQREKLDGDYFETSEIQDRNSLELDLEKAEKDHSDLVKTSEIVAETAGKLKIEFRGEIRKPTLVAELVKVGLAEVKLELADPRVRNLPGKDLILRINGEDGRIYQGIYSRDLAEKSMTRNARICIFTVQPLEPNVPVPSALTGLRMARVYRILPKPGHMLDKSKFLYQFSKEISELGWAAFIEKRWPDARVTYVAPKAVVVNLKHEN